MPKIIVTTRSGEERVLDYRPDMTLMQVITERGVNELLGLCGGLCACDSCHVYIDEDGSRVFPAMSEDEDYLLGGTVHPKPGSRLSCQIRLSDKHDGLRVTIAEDI